MNNPPAKSFNQSYPIPLDPVINILLFVSFILFYLHCRVLKKDIEPNNLQMQNQNIYNFKYSALKAKNILTKLVFYQSSYGGHILTTSHIASFQRFSINIKPYLVSNSLFKELS